MGPYLLLRNANLSPDKNILAMVSILLEKTCTFLVRYMVVQLMKIISIYIDRLQWLMQVRKMQKTLGETGTFDSDERIITCLNSRRNLNSTLICFPFWIQGTAPMKSLKFSQ